MESNEIFSSEWMEQWKQVLNETDVYARSALWNAPLIFRFNPVPVHIESQEIDTIGLFLDLHKGVCREIRYASLEDLSGTELVLTASPEIWTDVIKKKIDPVYLLLNGEINIEKGNLLQLIVEKDAAKILLESAQSITNSRLKDADSEVKAGTDGTETFIEYSRFVTEGKELDMNSYPVKLFQSAEKHGNWDPDNFSFETDVLHWQKLSEKEQKILIHLSLLFLADEETITLDLLPLMKNVSGNGRLEENIYLTSFLWDQAKLAKFFDKFTSAVKIDKSSFNRFKSPAYKQLLHDELPTVLANLSDSPQTVNQLKALVTHNMIIEGVLAETGSLAFNQIFKSKKIMPGLQYGLNQIQMDKSRHVAFGTYSLTHIINDHEELTDRFVSEMTRLFKLSIQIIDEIFELHDPVPFELEKKQLIRSAHRRFTNRMTTIAG